MKGKLELTCASILAVGLMLALASCATPRPEELPILDAVAAQSLKQRTSCAALNAAMVCEQSMRLSTARTCGCVDRNAISNGNYAPRF